MAEIKKTPKSNTIIQVAEATGLSPATISRVLNNHPYVKEATKKKVLEMIEKLGYQRNNIASGLRSNKTRTIGLIVPRISMFFHAEVITTIQNILYKHGYNLTICQSGDSVDMEKDLIRALQSVRVDAVIAACTLHTTDFTPFDQLMASGTPLVFYDRVPVGKTSAMVIKGDDIQGGYLATSHLIEIGCKKIAHISGPLDCNLYQDRLKGFYNAMKIADLPVRKEWLFYHELTKENARVALKKIFEGPEIPDGLVADNDTTAIAALKFAKEMGLKVPQDLKIVGYSNDPRSEIITPSITTIEQYPDKMGEKIVEVLMARLQHKNMNALEISTPTIMPVQLIRRLST